MFDFVKKKIANFKNYLSANKFYRKLTKHHKDKIFIWLGPCLGDVLFGMAYLKQFKLKNPDKRIALISCSNCRELIASYGGGVYDFLNFIPDNDVDSIGQFTAMTANHRVVAKGIKNKNYLSTLFVWQNRIYPTLSSLSWIKTHIFDLPQDTEISFHNLLPERIEFIRDFYRNADKMVVLNQFSTSEALSERGILYFEKICEFLKQEGYVVYSNVIGEQVPVFGSIPLRCNLSELLEIAYHIPMVISIRSGILDLIVKTNINMFVVYSGFPKTAYSLSQWECKGVISEVEGSEIEEDEDLNLFKKFYQSVTKV